VEERLDLSESAAKGAVVAQLSREIVQLHARHYGRGPTKARSFVTEECASGLLEEIYTVAERTLIETGAEEHVRETRQKFQEAVEEEFIEIVERVTGRTVRVFLSQVDIDTDLAVEFFLFEDQEVGVE
jgi:uncharacterized protein YbcI